MDSEELHCYCLAREVDPDMIACTECKKWFHSSCMRLGKPSPLAGDVYFTFVCANCSSDGVEAIKRKKLQWTLVVRIALYNLQLQGSGKCGYYHWQKHICQFIDRNWPTFFDEDRKKTATWHGTVAGCLSTGANSFFVSGIEVLGETGWWSLTSSKLPTLEELESMPKKLKTSRKRQAPSEVDASYLVGSRKKHINVVEATVALKEKKISMSCDVKSSKTRKNKSNSKIKTSDASDFLKLVVAQPQSTIFSFGQKEKSIPKIINKKEKESGSNYQEEDFNLWIKEPQLDLNLDVEDKDLDLFDFPNSLEVQSEFLTPLFDGVLSEINYDKVSIKQDYENEKENTNSSRTVKVTKKFHYPDTSRKRKAVTKDESPVKEITTDPKLILMCPYEEDQLLQKLENHPTSMSERPEVRRLYRKLMVRKLKRARKLQIFDLDAELRNFRGIDPADNIENDVTKPSVIIPVPKLNTILDRYQSTQYSAYGKSQQQASFLTRLMGLEDEDQASIVSPYTERILKPFIFRDFKTKPLKLCLLEEILTCTNKDNPEWKLPVRSPLDYCYVRPQHIPAINALCQEFFWPGIDLSESLQYPDFSCVALYKKIIIGFAFMVPDVKFNEANISFIFCHPEWRRSGIATFMLYHLIQTCMGKDITLHVSARSDAVLLYQKFGFKLEEFIYDYYDKYLPSDSKECRHALFLRLSR